MERNKKHISLIKNRLLTYSSRPYSLRVGHAENNEKIGNKIIEVANTRQYNLDYEHIIGAYYINENYFYYLETYGDDFILTRHIDDFERKTFLKKDEISVLKKVDDLNELPDIIIIGICYLVDFHKIRLGL